jgi:hypothetical protein
MIVVSSSSPPPPPFPFPLPVCDSPPPALSLRIWLSTLSRVLVVSCQHWLKIWSTKEHILLSQAIFLLSSDEGSVIWRRQQTSAQPLPQPWPQSRPLRPSLSVSFSSSTSLLLRVFHQYRPHIFPSVEAL